jgi:MinD-like ATPase involved in chromosome partitioning or flagellar assembly
MAEPVLVLLGPSPWEGSLIAGLAHPSSRVSIARRCLDTADLLATASSGLARVALLGADAPRLDSDVVHRLRLLGTTVVALTELGDAEAARRLHRWGADSVVVVDPVDLGTAVLAIAVAASAGVRDPAEQERAERESDAAGGRVVTVWGPAGAPGRTSVALAMADEAARLGSSVLLVDADTWAPSLGIVLGLVDDGVGLASACRRALAGALDVNDLAALSRRLDSGLHVLGGLPRPGRWTEVRAAALTEVLDVARRWVELVVVDCGSSLESDEELVFDTEAPRRNAATFVALEAADVVVVVGSADPVGLVRLVTGLGDLADVVPGADRRVVANRVRESLVGRRGDAAVAQALHRHAGVDLVTCVPDDPSAYDAALRDGRTLAEVAPSSPARAALRGLAVELLRDLGLREPRPLAAIARRRRR